MSLETNKFLQENCMNFRKGKKLMGITKEGEEVYSCKNFSRHLNSRENSGYCGNCVNWKAYIKEKKEYQRINQDYSSRNSFQL